jgi:hypothetical protein
LTVAYGMWWRLFLLLNISEHSRLLFRTRFFQQKHFDIYQIV